MAHEVNLFTPPRTDALFTMAAIILTPQFAVHILSPKNEIGSISIMHLGQTKRRMAECAMMKPGLRELAERNGDSSNSGVGELRRGIERSSPAGEGACSG